jgi:hypothetical protein
LALAATAAGRTLLLKLGFVLISGSAAAVHALIQAPRARSAAAVHPVASAVLGSISLLAAIAATLFGVVIAQAELICLNRGHGIGATALTCQQYVSVLPQLRSRQHTGAVRILSGIYRAPLVARGECTTGLCQPPHALTGAPRGRTQS